MLLPTLRGFGPCVVHLHLTSWLAQRPVYRGLGTPISPGSYLRDHISGIQRPRGKTPGLCLSFLFFEESNPRGSQAKIKKQGHVPRGTGSCSLQRQPLGAIPDKGEPAVARTSADIAGNKPHETKSSDVWLGHLLLPSTACFKNFTWLGVDSHSFQPSFFSKTSCFPRVLRGFVERRMPGKNGEGTPRINYSKIHTPYNYIVGIQVSWPGWLVRITL